MNETSSCPVNDGSLLGLAYELLDAHLDTVELMDLSDGFRWRVHLDYLRALVRKTEELLAGTPTAQVPTAAKAASQGREVR